MQGTNKLIIGAVVLILVAAGAFVAVKAVKKVTRSMVPVTQTTTPTESVVSETPASSPSAAASQNTITISANGFSPQTITIKVGDKVTWMNSDSANHTVNSAVHPTHLVYPPLNLGLIKPGEQKSLSFPTAGSYKYHDHLNPQFTGTVIVQ